VKQQPDETWTEGNRGDDRDSEWAVILAGGDGTCLKSSTRKIAGDERPKQFCSVLGDQTLLEETYQRAALELSRERTLYVVNRSHEEFYAPILGREPAQNILVPPSNRGTAPAILYGFYVSQRSILMLSSCSSRLTITFLTTTGSWPTFERHSIPHVQDATLVIVLGLDPESPEAEYGWIEPTAPIIGHSRVLGV
jgi:mannose-1-phosphate guanylyltransferase